MRHRKMQTKILNDPDQAQLRHSSKPKHLEANSSCSEAHTGNVHVKFIGFGSTSYRMARNLQWHEFILFYFIIICSFKIITYVVKQNLPNCL